MLLDNLNNKQKEAVEYMGGPLLVFAGAGSGKTRVLTHKIAYLIEQVGLLPENILAVTFTNKAANELKNRVTKMTGKKIDSWWIGTFHSVSARILRRYFNEVGLKENFVIIDKEDQIKIIKNICENEKIDDDQGQHQQN